MLKILSASGFNASIRSLIFPGIMLFGYGVCADALPLSDAADAPLVDAHLASMPQIPGRHRPEYSIDAAQAIPDDQLALISISIAPRDDSHGVAPSFIGLSWEKSTLYSPLFHVDKASDGGNDLAKLLDLLSLNGNFRIGANSLAYATWDPAGQGGFGDKPGDIQFRGPIINGSPSVGGKVSPPDIDALSQMIGKTGWKVIYAVPASYEFYKSDPDAETFSSAAYQSGIDADVQEAGYAARYFGSRLYALEIGNEPDLAVSSAYYLSDWINYGSAIKSAVHPAFGPLKFVGPSTSSYTSSFIGNVVSNSSIAPLIVQLTAHRYIGDGQSSSSTISGMLADGCSTANVSAYQAIDNASKIWPTAGGWRLDETNNFYHGGRVGVSDSHAAALWAARYMFCVAQQGAHGINFHVQDDTNPEQLQGSLNGAFANAYTPIQISKGQITKVMPSYYGMKLFSLAMEADTNAHGGFVLSPQSVTVSAPASPHISAYAVIPVHSTHVENIVVVNEDPTQSVKASISPGVRSDDADYIRLTSGPVSASGATAGLQGLQNSVLNNQPINVDGRWNPDTYAPLLPNRAGIYQVNIPAASAILIRLHRREFAGDFTSLPEEPTGTAGGTGR